MSDGPLGEVRIGDGAGVDDFLLPFQADRLDVRGRVLRLGPAIDALLKRHAYPHAVSRAVAEAVALTVLLGSALKLTGRFQLQTKTDGAIPMLVVDFEAPNKVRAYAQFDRENPPPEGPPAGLIGKGTLALTIDQGGTMNRYQGVVPLDGNGLEAAAHQYFLQSEQIPTRIKLAVGEMAAPGGGAWRAGGLFLQFLPEAPERMRQPTSIPAMRRRGRRGKASARTTAGPRRRCWPERSRIMSCSIRRFPPSGCSTGYSTSMTCASSRGSGSSRAAAAPASAS